MTSVPSLRPLATALALLSHGQGLGVACGWAQEIADQLTWRPKFAPKSVFWVVLEATSVFSMHQLPNIAPSWAPFGSSLVALNFFRKNSELTCILQYTLLSDLHLHWLLTCFLVRRADWSIFASARAGHGICMLRFATLGAQLRKFSSFEFIHPLLAMGVALQKHT